MVVNGISAGERSVDDAPERARDSAPVHQISLGDIWISEPALFVISGYLNHTYTGFTAVYENKIHFYTFQVFSFLFLWFKRKEIDIWLSGGNGRVQA